MLTKYSILKSQVRTVACVLMLLMNRKCLNSSPKISGIGGLMAFDTELGAVKIMVARNFVVFQNSYLTLI